MKKMHKNKYDSITSEKQNSENRNIFQDLHINTSDKNS
jgi:hypothetical protein